MDKRDRTEFPEKTGALLRHPDRYCSSAFIYG